MKKDLCRICGKEIDSYKGIERCASCWAIEKGLPDYIKTPNGLRFVVELLKKIYGLVVNSPQK